MAAAEVDTRPWSEESRCCSRTLARCRRALDADNLWRRKSIVVVAAVVPDLRRQRDPD